MSPTDDESRPGQERPRNDLLAGEIESNATSCDSCGVPLSEADAGRLRHNGCPVPVWYFAHFPERAVAS